jgi:hypothetical protein
MPSALTSGLVDVSAWSPALSLYVLESVTGPATLTGFYIDITGAQVGAAVSYSVTTSATTLTALAGGALPASNNGTVVGFIGTLSANCYVGFSGNTDGTFGQTPSSGYPIVLQASDIVTFGRVSAATIATAAGSGSASADGLASANVSAGSVVLYNGASFDRERSNIDSPALITTSGATTTQTGSDQTNYNGRGVKVVLAMTSVGTGSVTLEVDGKDAASGDYYAILTGAAVTSNSTSVYTVYPGVAATANAAVSDVLPRTWRIKVTANNANATTYTVGASVIV